MYILSVASGLTHGIIIISITGFHKTPFDSLSYIRSCLTCSIPDSLLKSTTKRNRNIRDLVRDDNTDPFTYERVNMGCGLVVYLKWVKSRIVAKKRKG